LSRLLDTMALELKDDDELHALYVRADDHSQGIDVTEQVNGLIDGGVLRLDGDHHLLAGDPFPGIVKILKVKLGSDIIELEDFKPAIVLVNEDSLEKLPETALNLKAYYAQCDDLNERVDVTNQLLICINNGVLELDGDHNSLFGDPFPGVAKQLIISVDESVHMVPEDEAALFYIQDDGVVRLNNAAAVASFSAFYHRADNAAAGIDITAYIKPLIGVDGALALDGKHHELGAGDPFPGVPKVLTLKAGNSSIDLTDFQGGNFIFTQDGLQKL